MPSGSLASVSSKDSSTCLQNSPTDSVVDRVILNGIEDSSMDEANGHPDSYREEKMSPILDPFSCVTPEPFSCATPVFRD